MAASFVPFGATVIKAISGLAAVENSESRAIASKGGAEKRSLTFFFAV